MTNNKHAKRLYFGKQLKNLMTENNINSMKLSNILNCSHASVINWINGRAMIQPKNRLKLCNYFNVNENYFYEKEDNPIFQFSSWIRK